MGKCLGLKANGRYSEVAAIRGLTVLSRTWAPEGVNAQHLSQLTE